MTEQAAGMEEEPRWDVGTLSAWFESLDLLSWPWLRPFLGEMGIPPQLVIAIDQLGALGESARVRWEEALCATAALGGQTGREEAALCLVVTEALQGIAQATTPEEAAAFESWVRRHLISPTQMGALMAWRMILRRVCGLGGRRYPLHEPPAALLRQLSWLSPALDERWVEPRRSALLHAAPPMTEEEEEMGLREPPIVARILDIMRNERVRSALLTLHQALSPEEMGELLAWARAQAQVQEIPNTQALLLP